VSGALLVNPRTSVIERKLPNTTFIPLSSSAQKNFIQSTTLRLSEASDFAAIKEVSPEMARGTKTTVNKAGAGKWTVHDAVTDVKAALLAEN
jgi:hypothetical protein